MNYEISLEHRESYGYLRTLISCVVKTATKVNTNFPCFEKEQQIKINIHGTKQDMIYLHLKASFDNPVRTNLTEDKLRHLVDVYFSKIPEEIRSDYLIEDYFEDLKFGRKIDYLDIQEKL